ncbi:hypothetical protein SODALDRAFT_362588 [Sodiomyces alkalinus F11]|uniref:Uncharacterized protein n=1 Tax=Sodiomyces alkalinus (strain CBS 110278 / VKM F-3762 / F11) TaxID=1314773 RepID=A0A3N2PMK8_SODAK|nr:hypothetical protein SODALDRAFT_362588 [Sodiomyces alkalinus F11]ROT35758.1 hypothetical protein SODALDRAFT_362588 [Sodiomyces alkalinus F11]
MVASSHAVARKFIYPLRSWHEQKQSSKSDQNSPRITGTTYFQFLRPTRLVTTRRAQLFSVACACACVFAFAFACYYRRWPARTSSSRPQSTEIDNTALDPTRLEQVDHNNDARADNRDKILTISSLPGHSQYRLTV